MLGQRSAVDAGHLVVRAESGRRAADPAGVGVRNVRLGPTLPAFLTPALVNVLVEKFGIQPIGDAKADIEASLSRAA